MVKRYDVVKAGCQAIFEWMCMFSHFSTTEVNNVDRIMQSAYLCVILYSNTKYYHFRSVWTSFLILAKIQDGGLDGNYYWWRHRLSVALAAIKYTSCCWKDQRLSTEGKIVSKYCNLSKPPGRHLSAPSPLYQGGGMNLRVRPWFDWAEI